MSKQKYRITVNRTSTRKITLQVEAGSLEEAEEIALKEAPNHYFPSTSENEAEYSVE